MAEPEKDELADLLDFHGVVHAGDVLVVECDQRLTADQSRALSVAFDAVHAKFGVGIILLDGGLRVAGRKRTE